MVLEKQEKGKGANGDGCGEMNMVKIQTTWYTWKKLFFVKPHTM